MSEIEKAQKAAMNHTVMAEIINHAADQSAYLERNSKEYLAQVTNEETGVIDTSSWYYGESLTQALKAKAYLAILEKLTQL